MLQLTENAIPKMLKVQQGKNESYIVDVVKLKKKAEAYVFFLITDGKATCKSFIDASQPHKDIQILMKNNNNQPLRIKITAHNSFSSDQKTAIQIVQFEVVKPKPVETKLQFTYKTKPLNFVKRQQTQKKVALSIKPKPPSEQSQQQSAQTTDIDIKGFELISDLYQTFYGWVLLVRVTSVKYDEFTSKAGNFTKILSVELIDRCENVITGKFFGDIADMRHKMIEQGKIYRVSRGKIVVDKYLAQGNRKVSKYLILFTKDSQFLEVVNIPHFPNSCENWLRLSQITHLPSSDSAYNFVGVMIELNDEVTIEKQGRSIVFQHLKIADPISDLVYRCTIWNRTLKVNKELIGKSILIKNCKVSSYKGQISLCTTSRSAIALHPYFAKFNDNLEHFQILQKETRVFTIKQILNDISEEKRTTVKTVQAWISEVCFNMKWYYESCGNCRKSCPSNTTCSGCSLLVREPLKRWRIPIELSDYTGAIRVTSFQQSATVVLNNLQIPELLKMEESELNELGNAHCFQQYRMQIATKRDENGRINHSIVGKPIQVNVAKSTARNFQAIRQMTTSMKKNQ